MPASIALVLGALVACGAEEGEVISSGPTTILVQGASDTVLVGALVAGRLQDVGGCLGVDDAVVVWPPGTDVAQDEPLVVDVPGYGTLTVGERVDIGASAIWDPEDADGRSADDVTKLPVPSGCEDHVIWWAD